MKLIDFLNKLRTNRYIALVINEEFECITLVGNKTLFQFYDYEIDSIETGMVNDQLGIEIHLREKDDAR